MKISPKLIWLFLLHHLTTRPYKGPEKDTFFEIIPLDFNIKEFYENISEYKETFEISTIERIEYKEDAYPIHQININPKGKKKLFILSGTHGNEHAGLLSILELLEQLKQNNDFIKDTHVRIITPHNPTGAKYFSRMNYQGYDLNRDFKRLDTKENIAVIKSVEEFRPDLCLTLHEGPQDGAFIFTNKYISNDLTNNILTDFAKNKVKLAKKSYFGNNLETPGLFRISGLFAVLSKLQSSVLNIETLDERNLRKEIPTITLGTFWGTKNNRISPHLSLMKSCIKFMNQPQR